MTIRRGEPWGEPGVVPPNSLFANDDADAAALIGAALTDGPGVPDVVLVGGDMARTMGGGTPGRAHAGATLVRATVDVLSVSAAGAPRAVALAHVVVRASRGPLSWWRGPVALLMNAQYIGAYDVAPRSHPNDGRVDCVWVDGSMSIRQRVAARRRARTGVHVPHPLLRTESARSVEVDLGRRVDVWLDGRWWARVDGLSVEVLTDAAVVLA